MMGFLDRFISAGVLGVFVSLFWCLILMMSMALGFHISPSEADVFIRIIFGSVPVAFCVGFIFPQITGLL